MDCKEIATVSSTADKRDQNIVDRTRSKEAKKLKHEINVDDNFEVVDEQISCFSVCNIDQLPNEILYWIFSYLNIQDRTIFENVCSRWREIGTGTWNDIRVLNPKMLGIQKRLKLSKLLEALERCSLSLVKLEINCTALRLKRFPVEICEYCPNLKSIILRDLMSTTTTKNVMVMINGWKNLTEISFPCSGNAGDRSISEECLSLLFEAYNIEYLDLTNNYSIYGKNFNLLKDSLQSLILNGCNQISPGNLEHIKNLHAIRNLQLDECQFLTSTILISIVKSLQSSLIELHLGGNYIRLFDKHTFLDFVNYAQNIQILHFPYNEYIDNVVVSAISKTCLQLRVLDLTATNVTNECLCNLATLPRLQHLYLNTNDFISYSGLLDISESRSLKHIEIQLCSNIENNGVMYLARNCRTLTVIDASYCWDITQKLVQMLWLQLPRNEDYVMDVIIGDGNLIRFAWKHSIMYMSSQKKSCLL